MITETVERVICISHNKDSVLSEKSDRDIPDESRLEFVENLRAKHLNLVNPEGIKGILLFNTLLQSQEPKLLKAKRFLIREHVFIYFVQQ